MKFMTQKLGQTGLLISLCVIVSACNPSEYYPTEEFIQGIDSYCSEAKDADSCSAMHWCQPAYNDGGDTPETMVFAGCVANPDFLPPSDGSTAGSTTGSTDGSATAGSTDGSTAGGSTAGSTTGGTDGSTTGGTTGGTDGSTTGGTAGGTTAGGSTAGNGGNNGNGNGGGNNGNGNGGGNGGSVGTGPIADAYQSKCANLDEKYLFVKKLVSKKSTSKVVKVKVCHVTGNTSAHTIIIACPALKGHIPHEDYLGSCEL